MHTHVTASGQLIECKVAEHLDHWIDLDGNAYHPGLDNASSVHYADPEDPRGHGACNKAIESLRQGLTVYQPLAGQMQALLAEAMGLMRDTAMGRHLLDNEMHPALFEECTEMLCAQARAFLSRPEIAAIVKERK